jgi:hypothetical protein
MENKILGLTFALLGALALGQPALADDLNTTTDTQVSRPVDTNMDDRDVSDVNEVDDNTADTWSSSSTPAENGDINVNVDNQPAVAAPAATTTGQVDAPRSYPSVVRLIPVAGASSFTTGRKVEMDNFDNGFTAGLLADFGSSSLVFETGALALNAQSSADSANDSASIDVNSWGIPLLGKWNLSGHPHSTVFLKAGVMPFQTSGSADNNFDILGVAGIGGAIPLFKNTALTLDASYNRLFEDDGDLGTFQGVALLGGLQIGL